MDLLSALVTRLQERFRAHVGTGEIQFFFIRFVCSVFYMKSSFYESKSLLFQISDSIIFSGPICLVWPQRFSYSLFEFKVTFCVFKLQHIIFSRCVSLPPLSP